MARKKPDFPFGANKKPGKGKSKKGGKKGKGRGKSNAWRAYVSSSATIPD